MRGQLRELIAWLEGALADPNATDTHTRAKGLLTYGTAVMFAEKGAPEGIDRSAGFARAESALEESVRLFRDLADRRQEASALEELGYTVWMTSQSPTRAVSLLEAALAIYRELGNHSASNARSPESVTVC